MVNRIVLVGFSGSGKSTYGRRLARRLGMEFFDLDQCFEAHYHITIMDFFSKYGEESFRICEYSLLKDVLSRENCVISTGGGTPCFFDSMDLIKMLSVSIYIQLSVSSLVDRLMNSKKPRPLTRGRTLEDLHTYVTEELSRREVYYKRADLCVKGEGLTAERLENLLTSQMQLSFRDIGKNKDEIGE